MKPTYNLTFWQRLELIPMRMMWLNTPETDRRSWHEIKKGMEKHTCKFTIPDTYLFRGKGHPILKCEHEGCNTVLPVD